MDAAEYALMDLAEQEMWWYRALHRRLLAALPAGGRVLDAGCGTGGLLVRMAGVPEAFGIDFSPVAAARAVLKSGRPVACGSVGGMPFADAGFDAAVTADVLCHRAVDPGAALVELRRVLRPGGRLVVNMPAYAWLASAHDRRVHNARRVTAGELRGWLAAAGFERITTRYWNGLLLPVMVLHRITRRAEAASDVAPFPPWLDTILHGVTRLEQMLPFPLPAGGSVLAIAHTPHHR